MEIPGMGTWTSYEQEKTLRDEIALAAMVAMLSGVPKGVEKADLMAKKAYRWADAMLKARAER